MRLLGFVALVFVAFLLLGQLPFLQGSLLRLWIAVIVVSVLVSRLGDQALLQRRVRNEIGALQQVDSPHNRGKLGSLYLSAGRPRRGLPHLEAALAGEPGSSEWGYRLGCAQLALGQHDAAAATLRGLTSRDEEYAYGAAQMRLAEALFAGARRRESREGAGGYDLALEALDVFERNHGESPESAYRRGLVLKALGRRDEARRCLRRVGQLARSAARYQRRSAAGWALKAALARLF